MTKRLKSAENRMFLTDFDGFLTHCDFLRQKRQHSANTILEVFGAPAARGEPQRTQRTRRTQRFCAYGANKEQIIVHCQLLIITVR